MKKTTKILTITMVAVIVFGILINSNISVKAFVVDQKPVKVAVFLYKFGDEYIDSVRENLKKIQKNNEGKVEFTFYDGKNDQSIQNDDINSVIKDSIDLLLVNPIDTKVTQDVVNKAKENNIPVIFFNREPISVDAIKSYGKACFIGTDAKEAGIFQGKILIDAWNANKSIIDKNKDNIMQYVMLKGENNNIEANDRTKYSVSTINDAGIKTEQVALAVCDWDKELAKNATESLFLRYGNKIEVIIANNDAMAQGAVLALQENGYNDGDIKKTIPIVGVDATKEAQELIKKGFMTGSVLQDSSEMAEALYTVGMNLVNNKSPIDSTAYKFDETGVAIRIPYKDFNMNS